MTDAPDMDVHTHLRELLAAVALGTATDDDARAAREHLATCSECRVELGSLEQAVTALGYATVGDAPPPQLRARVLDAIAVDADASGAGERIASPVTDSATDVVSATVVSIGWRRRARRFVAPALAAACVVLVIATVDARREVDDLRGDVVAAERSADAARDRAARAPFVTDQVVDISTTGPLEPAHGNVAMEGDSMVIVLRGMPDPASGHVWQAWLTHQDPDQPPTSLGTMEQSSGLTVLPLDGVDTSSLESLIITLEPSGGSQRPTGPTDATAQFV